MIVMLRLSGLAAWVGPAGDALDEVVVLRPQRLAVDRADAGSGSSLIEQIACWAEPATPGS
jgi:hypothetical protein